MNATGCEIIVLLGSNVADARMQMACAYNWLKERMTITAASRVYTSPPFNGTGPEYYNRVVKGTFAGSAEDFELLAKDREKLQGRMRATTAVTIDIDLIIFDGIPVRPSDMSREYFQQGYQGLTAFTDRNIAEPTSHA